MNVTDRQTDDRRTEDCISSRLLNTQRFDFKMINTEGLGNTFTAVSIRTIRIEGAMTSCSQYSATVRLQYVLGRPIHKYESCIYKRSPILVQSKAHIRLPISRR